MNSFLLRSHSTRHPHSPTRGKHDSPADSPNPPRPKSTLGFSSRFAHNWKASISSASRSSTRSSPVNAIAPYTPSKDRPSTPLPSGHRRQKDPVVPLASPVSPVDPPQTPTATRRPAVSRKPETPRTRAIHIEWRISARQLEGDWKDCLMGAECLRVFDPLEGVKMKLVNMYSPKKAFSHLVVKPTPSSTLTIASPVVDQRNAKSPTPPSFKPLSPTSRTANASPTPLSRRPLVNRRTVDYIPIPPVLPASITPRSARRMRHSLRMTPMAPLKPVCYVPLKSPAPSPRVSKTHRQSLVASPKSTKPSSAQIMADQVEEGDSTTMEESYMDGEMECSILLERNDTPPSFDDTELSPLSPWHVVRPASPIFDDEAEWVITSPIR